MKRTLPSAGLAQTIVADSCDAILVMDIDGKTIHWNDATEEIFGFSSSDLLGQSFLEQVAPSKDSAAGAPRLSHLTGAPSGQCKWNHFEFEARHADGKTIWIDMRISQTYDGTQSRWVVISRNVDETKRRHLELKLAATTDFLSGISNRREFQRVLETNIAKEIGLAILDVDHFKSINDQFGHLAGDQAIRTVADSLSQFFPDALCVARLGGEEFGVVVSAPQTEPIVQQFERYRQQFGGTLAEEITAKFTISIGLAFNQDKNTSVRALLTGADLALYESKKNGRNQVTTARIESNHSTPDQQD